jgi:phospholipase D1/2
VSKLVDGLEKALASVQGHPLLPLVILGAFLAAGVLFISVWLVIFQTGLLVAPPWGFFLALAGSLLSASTFFALGRFVFAGFIARKASPRVLRAVKGAGLEHIIALRILPILPFTLINMTAGALGVSFRTFFLGTLIGMAPGILAITVLGDRAIAVIRHPTPLSVLALVGTALSLVAVATLMRRYARKRSPVVDEPVTTVSAPPGTGPGSAS